MKHVVVLSFILFLGLGVQAGNEPHIGFSFPAGGQQGTSFDMLIGGQHLQGATNIFVNSEGIDVEIETFSVKYDPQRIRQFYNRHRNLTGSLEDKEGKAKERTEAQIKEIERQLKLADFPEEVDPLNKKEVQRFLRQKTKDQFNPQIEDRLRVRVSISPKAPPGEHELRVYTPKGLSNPIYFQVGLLNEVEEVEPNDDHMNPELLLIEPPAVINGQVMPGDIDHIRFAAKKGDSLVVDVGARRIIPYLADAVPGWFQAVVSIYDEEGHEVAYQDDYKFSPDPVLFFDVPEDGTYTLSIRDSIYRGREDFIYRIAVGELPFITSIFPLGAQKGKDVDIALSGKNLPQSRVSGKLPDELSDIRHVSVKKEGYRSNLMPFAIGDLGEILEQEPNNTQQDAQSIQIPVLVNGRIQRVGDRDLFSFEGEKGDTVSVEVTARRLNSPLDSVITLSGPGMEKPIRNDDYVSKDKTHLHLGSGLVTHHADSYLLHELPETGTYFLEIGDSQQKSGHDYAYRLRIGKALPDFRLRMEPSGLHISPGGTAVFTVRATRLDGFEGEIKLKAEQLPEGFTMSESVIAAASETTRFTITAPQEIPAKAVSPKIVGVVKIDGEKITRPAVPVDDQMQAFLYRHLVPAQELVLAPIEQKPPFVFEAKMPKSGIINVPLGKEIKIQFKGQVAAKGGKGVALKLNDAPEGISLVKGWLGRQRVKGKTPNGKPKFDKTAAWGQVVIKAEEPLKAGDQISLVVEAEVKKGREKVYYPAPAIPIRIMEGKPNADESPSAEKKPAKKNAGKTGK